MIRTKPSLTALAPAMIALGVSLFNPVAHADTEVLTGDGREVLLRDDGSWEYRSNDRILTTGDGRQVRLKQDGRWEYTGNAPVVEAGQVKTRELGVTLRRAVIERHQIKVQKSLRLKTQTVFYLDIELSSQAPAAISFADSDMSAIEVRDNNGERYTVLSIHPDVKTLEPGSNTGLTVRVKGSPTWMDNARDVGIEFRPAVFGTRAPIRLNQRVDEFEEVEVDGFETE